MLILITLGTGVVVYGLIKILVKMEERNGIH